MLREEHVKAMVLELIQALKKPLSNQQQAGVDASELFGCDSVHCFSAASRAATQSMNLRSPTSHESVSVTSPWFGAKTDFLAAMYVHLETQK